MLPLLLPLPKPPVLLELTLGAKLAKPLLSVGCWTLLFIGVGVWLWLGAGLSKAGLNSSTLCLPNPKSKSLPVFSASFASERSAKSSKSSKAFFVGSAVGVGRLSGAASVTLLIGRLNASTKTSVLGVVTASRGTE